MKNKKLIRKRVGIFLLMIVFCSCLIINYSENYFSFSRKITHHKSELEDNELKTLNKLEKDLKTAVLVLKANPPLFSVSMALVNPLSLPQSTIFAGTGCTDSIRLKALLLNL